MARCVIPKRRLTMRAADLVVRAAKNRCPSEEHFSVSLAGSPHQRLAQTVSWLLSELHGLLQ
jgi:hypothetical protein